MYIQVINGQVSGGGRQTPPAVITKGDGSTVSNTGALSDADLIQLGWYPVVKDALLNYQTHGTPTVNADNVSYPAVDLPLADAKTQAKSEMAQARWETETGGIVWNGYGIATDRESQSLITGAWTKAHADVNFTVNNWKCLEVATGNTVFISLTNSDIIAIGDAVAAHVESVFDTEAAKNTAIDAAADLTALRAITWES